ncbi:MAG: YjbQ family protein [Frankiaceae bacterium]|jgi:secondary thiamine-phosphate synthase enzyme
MDSVEVRVETGDRLLVDLSERIEQFCRGRGDGLLSLFAPHATAGLAMIELGSGTEADLADTLARLLPRDDRYRHKHGSTGHGADHLLPAFISPSMTIPVIEGRAQLGTWQSVVLVDTNVDNPFRRVRLSFLPATRGHGGGS